MTDRVYKDVPPIGRRDAEKAFASTNPKAISSALVRMAFHDPDWRWVQGWCVRFIGDANPDIRGLAATCLGHIARIHRTLDEDGARAVLNHVRDTHTDGDVRGRAADAIEDIARFVVH